MKCISFLCDNGPGTSAEGSQIPCRKTIKSCRIKIQLIEFLCENSPPSLREGGDKFWVLRRTAEGSQICDLDLILMRETHKLI